MTDERTIATSVTVAGYVTAGGASARFGRDKALAEIAGKPLLVRICELVFDTVTRDVSVIGAASKYGKYGFRCVEDLWPGEGPFGGILTALLETAKRPKASPWNLILSCDMPFLTEGLLVYCVDRAKRSHADVVVPESSNGLEPLCACWRTEAIRKLQYAFEDGIRKVTEAMKRVSMEIVDEKDWARFDKSGRLFWNINTLAEYEEARRILESGGR